ncbi:afadin [Kryptolebias marmoratus]|uniref:afadin n=1 Tax=Kryptolebias marmoratus TaxID=37003 RepID=UPI0018ACB592|nr:afadin [Kryptolebias marmoratus]
MSDEEEREKLAKVIRQWNSSRLDLFEMSQPDEKLEFHGVIRFYFEDDIKGNVATKCLRVSSSSPSREIVETLSEKFRPDMKMLSTNYSLHEIHTDKERKLEQDEKPLIVQLSWKSDSRGGRFVLKKDQDSLEESCLEREKGGVLQTFKRTLSRKGKKAAGLTQGAENGSAEELLNVTSLRLSNFSTRRHSKGNERQQSQTLEDFSKQPGLPVRVQISDNAEEAFLSAVINYTNSSTVHFKLSPAYILYAASRFVLLRHHSRGSQSSGSAHTVASITNKMVAMTRNVIQRQQTIAGALAFWMANSSELLNFLKHDEDLRPLTQQSQLDLSHLVQKAYSLLLRCQQNELRKHLPIFLIDPEQHGALPAGIEMVLNTLMNAMSLFRRCRVNPALTIQLFSQLFHFISAWLFNQLMKPEATAPGLRSHYWGSALRRRLAPIEAWAERQGLELAADCHLGHIIQATTLLTMNKYSTQDAKDIRSTCFKLNSLQLRVLLAGYLYATNEPHIPPDLIDAVVGAAGASDLSQSEGQDIQLEESLDLPLPFLLPEGGYSCDTVRGIPQGFQEFLEPICQKGLCSLTRHPKSKGDWTVYFSELAHTEEDTYLEIQRQPEIETISLHKPLNSGMGISIVAAKGAGQENVGIYIKSVVRGGPAEMSGRLAAGDQLLSADGQSLLGLSQERAAAVMTQTGPVVTLQVAKSGASYHGLEALLNDSTPGDEDHPKEASMPPCVVDLCPSGRLLGGSRSKKEQIMQRNRQLYRSNPNMTADFGLQGGEESADPDVKRNIATSISSINLCTDTFQREYLTLPNPKSRDRVESELSRPQQTFKASLSPSHGQSSCYRTLMRQALSQESLCVDSGGPLLDKRQSTREQRDQISSSPIRSSVSTHNICSDHSSPLKQQQGSHKSTAGAWRTPFSQQSTPSARPICIDIPLTRAVSAQSNPLLSTFQQSSLVAVKRSQALKTKQSPQSPIYASPISATKKQPRPPVPWQQQRPSTCGGRAEKPQVSVTPAKHVSFQEPPSKPKTAGPVKQRDRRELRDPWRREAQEKLREQGRLQAVELLQKEVQLLQAKAERTAAENEQLGRLSLEWRFQMRLQEVQKRGEEEEEDEDWDTMVTLQQLGDTTPKAENNGCCGGNNWEQKEEKQTGSHFSHKEDKEKGANELKQDDYVTQTENVPKQTCKKRKTIQVFRLYFRRNPEERIKRASAPEKLPFGERRRLFTLASSA